MPRNTLNLLYDGKGQSLYWCALLPLQGRPGLPGKKGDRGESVGLPVGGFSVVVVVKALTAVIMMNIIEKAFLHPLMGL